MNNGIFVQGVYGKAGFENSLPKPLLGSTNVIPVPYHLVPSTEWNINYNNLVMVVDTSLIATPTVSFVAAGGSATPWSIDWGDGYIDSFSSYNNTTVSHTYSSRGIFIIQVRGNVIAPRLSSQPALIKILSFSSSLTTIANYFTAFRINTNLVELPKTIPSNITSFNQTFAGTTRLNDPNISRWNTSSLTNVNSMFFGSSFNQDLGSWNTGNITDMGGLFSQSSFNNGGSDGINNWNTANVTVMNIMFQLTPFNQPLNNWNVSKVTSFADMFNNARSFNGNMGGWQLIANGVSCAGMFNHFGWGPGGALATDNGFETWNTSGVVDMSRMFESQKQFNADLGLWNTINVTNMSRMFLQSSVFNNGNSSTINNWNTSNVTNMSSMFRDAFVFNQPLNNWNTSKVTNFGDTFGYALQFNQPLNNWNVRKSTSFVGMFQGATSFNSSLSGWALGADTAATSCANMFNDCPSFNQDIGDWDVSKVTNMNFMFSRTTLVVSGFNNGGSPSISGWNTSNVTNMGFMFANINNFNQPIGSWNVSKVTTMNNMFQNAMAFNQNISSWNLTGLNVNTALDGFMLNKTGANALSTANYDALLIGWNNNKLASANGVANWRTDLRPNFGGAKYTAGGAAAAARAALVTYGWTITDGGVA